MAPNPTSSDNSNLPLPDGWIRTFSNSQGRYYYSHKDTKHTQWHFPSATEARDPWLAKQRAEEKVRKERDHTPSVDVEALGTATGKRPRTDYQFDAETKKVKTRLTPVPEAAAAASFDENDVLALAETTNVAIIVPFRDLHIEQKRSAHLAKFIPHMIKFLGKLHRQQQISDYHIYIIEQSDDQRKFNRGKLLNIGFDIARKRKMKRPHDVFIFHDVDLLPQDDLSVAYAHFPKVPHHIARVWNRYSGNKKYFGGVVSFSLSDYKRINGYPNTFWGWGGEDDELQERCHDLGIKWDWPRQGTFVDLEEMSLDEKIKFLRQHKEWKCAEKWEVQGEHKETWKQNGLVDLKYKVLSSVSLDTKDPAKSKATKITVDVMLNGDHWSNKTSGVNYVRN